VRSQEIKDAIINQLHRGVTVYKSTGGVGSTGRTEEEREILYCVVTRLEIARIRNLVTEIDPVAFITIQALSDVHGGLVKKQLFH
jgi:uncharacterized membrane-anchored protein YitT (DUF2179 family)